MWTIVRPSSFASNALRWAGPIRAGDPVPNLTGAGRQGVIDPRDVGMDQDYADVVVDGAVFVRDGGNAVLTDDVRRLLGRPPGSFRTWAHDHRHVLR